MGVVAAVPVTLMRLCWGVRACGYPVSCHVDHSGGSPGPFPSRGGVWGSAEHPRVLPQLELLEVRRQQEEEERKRKWLGVEVECCNFKQDGQERLSRECKVGTKTQG